MTIIIFKLFYYEESLEHLFLHCRFSKNFWNQIVSWLNDLNITIIELKDSEITVGHMNESPHCFFPEANLFFLNHVLIIGKQVIYSGRLSKSKAQGKRRILVEFNSSNLFILK